LNIFIKNDQRVNRFHLAKISSQIVISKNTLKEYLYYLHESLLIYLLRSEEKSDSRLSKAEKIYLYHPNLMYSLSVENVNQGTVRESFFINQLQTSYQIHDSKKGDFLIDLKYTFEIGGKNKKYNQIADLKNSFSLDD
jgi:predicted AAA+ superfamily ATPase